MNPAFYDGNCGADASPIRVLLAEDDFLLRFEAAASMRRLGWDVVEVSSADEAMELLRYRLHFDLLLTDTDMPGRRDGVDLARLAREQFPDMKIALMSDQDPLKLEAAPHDLILKKPVLDAAERLVGLMEKCRK